MVFTSDLELCKLRLKCSQIRYPISVKKNTHEYVFVKNTLHEVWEYFRVVVRIDDGIWNDFNHISFLLICIL